MAPKKSSKPKDKNAPKRSQSAYLLYTNEKRPGLKKEKPEAKVTDIMKELAALWKKLDEKEKEVYVKKAEELKEEYKKKLVEYQKSDEYKKYQKALNEWKAEQKDAKKANKANKKKTEKKTKKVTKKEKEAEKESEKESEK